MRTFRSRYIVLLLCVICVFSAKSQGKQFPYALSNTDYVWISTGAASYAIGYYLGKQITPLTSDQILGLDAGTINGFDQSATSKWNTTLDTYGAIGKYTLFIAPSAMLISPLLNKQWTPFITYSIMYFEMALLTTGITELTKSLTLRTRPFLYNNNLSLEEKELSANEYGDQDSFFSGHSSIAFASAVFLSKTYTDIYGKSVWSKVIWGSSLTVAGLMAYSRYESGQHFPTDIIAGAALGALVGYAIPHFHHNKGDKLGVVISPNYFHLSYKF